MKIFAAIIFCAAIIFSRTAAAEVVGNSEISRAVKLLNEVRAEAGLPALTWKSSSKLQKAAKIRARELEVLFSHNRPNGSSCFTALDECGVKYMACAENIAYGTDLDAAGAIELWKNSEGHYENMTNDKMKNVGLAAWRVGNFVYWVQLFTD